MAKIRKNLLLLVLSFAMVLSCFVGVMPFMNKVAKADGEPATYTYQMIGGAQVRKVDDDSAGLRFVSYIDARGYDENAGLTYGMLIAPLDYIQDVNKGKLTPANVFGNDAKYCVTDGCTTCGKAHIINLTSDKLVDVTAEVTKAELAEDGQSYVGFKGVITRIKEDNYLRKFVGLAYVYDENNAENPYTFVEYNESNARSVAYVAKKSLDKGVEDTPKGRLAEYVAKSYETYTFDATASVALNENIVAEGTFIKDSQPIKAGEVTATIKSGLKAYQYANNKVLSGKAVGELVTVTVSTTSPDGAYTYTKDVENVEVKKGDYELLPDVSVGLNRTSSEINVGVAGNYTMSVDGVNVESTTSNGVVTFNNSVLSVTSGYGYKTAT
ncbi:MAG: hypothetical protein J6U92_07450, partial [Clostridia bacterium]|nr:hypothetical protein [Clostridia bacterium]